MEEEKTNTNSSVEEKPKCDQCGREFKNMAGVNMHKVRAHGPGWDTSGNFKHARRKQTKEEVLQWKRAYNKRYREKLKRLGLPTRGNLGIRKPHKKVQYVYPDLEQQRAEVELEQVQIPTLKHCPACGEHLVGWKYQP